jgi:MFS family permease
MLNPSIYVFNIRIDEPVTTLTDLMVSAICFYAWFQLRKRSSENKILAMFSWFFILMGIATMIGGLIGHAFLYALSFSWKLPGWLVSMMSINLLERAVIRYSDPLMKPAFSKFFSRFNVLELLVFASLAFGTLNFQYVEIHSAYGIMVVVFGFALFNFFKGNRGPVVMNLVGGVIFALLAAVIFTLRLSINEWFNYIDISHLMMAITAIFFYRAASAIEPANA